tara:strand:- start:9384 stop:9698 length:315 start_codon:yes stop_codon:yes gene_type:complete
MYLPNEEFIKTYSDEYLDYIKLQSCCITGSQDSDCHHLEAIGMGQNRKKPNQKHFTAIPLTRELHTEVHAIGINKFQEKYNIQLWQEAYYYFAKWILIKMGKTE